MYCVLLTAFMVSFLAFNSSAGAVMAFGIVLSTIVHQNNIHIWYLDATVALCIAIGLFGYGIK